jgi:hypothetical protein
MKHLPVVLFCLSFTAFCAVAGFCVLLFFFPYGVFRPVIACDTKVLELGTIDSETEVDCQFTIKNIGKRELLLREAVPACGSGNEIEVTTFSLEPLLPGEQRELMIQFLPYIIHGKVLRKLVVVSNDPQFPRLILSISATVNHVPPPPSPPVPLLAPMVN